MGMRATGLRWSERLVVLLGSRAGCFAFIVVGNVFSDRVGIVLDNALQATELGAFVQTDQCYALRGAAEFPDLGHAGTDQYALVGDQHDFIVYMDQGRGDNLAVALALLDRDHALGAAAMTGVFGDAGAFAVAILGGSENALLFVFGYQHGDDTLALWERSGGRLQTEGWRSRYVPVALIEPLPSNRQALGYDIHSDPVRAEAIRRALATGRAQASAPVQLVQDAGQQPGMLLLLPVPQRGPIRPQEPPLGFAVGVYRLGDLLADSFVDPTWRSLQFRLLDVTPGAPAQELAALPAVPAPASPLLSSQTFPHAGRLWQLQVRPTAAFLASYGAPISSSLLLAALAVSVLLEAFLLLMSGQERQSRLQLEERLQTSLMTAAMAHEIKQPLTTLLMRSSLLDRVLANPLPLPRRQELEEVAHGIRVDVKRLSTTINQVRELMQQGEVQRRPLDLRNPVHGALMLVQAEAERCQVSVLTRGLEQPAACIGDRDQLQLMVLNLLRNSIEAVPSGGQVELRLEQRASGLRLEVADDGPGFPASTLAAAGLPIASSKQRGFGLGLYLVRRAVANHDGQLLLGRSDLGGASAQVLLPVAGLAGPSLRRSAPPRPEP